MPYPTNDNIFHRTALADRIADQVLGHYGASGVFIAAPRRTGKSTLLVEDMLPCLERKACEVIYVDLWGDRDRDAGELIAQALRKHLRLRESRLLKWARKGGLGKVKLGGLEFDIDKVGIGGSTTYSAALAELSDATQRPVVLIIDEVQQALTSNIGAATLFALKAARDQLNSSAHHGFRLIATGSNRDKLSLLVHGHDQAFMNATLVDLELLGDDYLQWELDRHGDALKPSLPAATKAFALAGRQPEILRKALNDLAFSPRLTARTIDSALLSAVRKIRESARLEFLGKITVLPPLQAAVLGVMAKAGRKYAPFRPHTKALYEAAIRKLTPEPVNIDDSAVEYALEALRNKALVWKSAHGVYAIEESQHRTLLARRA